MKKRQLVCVCVSVFARSVCVCVSVFARSVCVCVFGHSVCVCVCLYVWFVSVSHRQGGENLIWKLIQSVTEAMQGHCAALSRRIEKN